jgi:hypothetical protein
MELAYTLHYGPSDTLAWYPSIDVFGSWREFAWDKHSMATSYSALGNAVSCEHKTDKSLKKMQKKYMYII